MEKYKKKGSFMKNKIETEMKNIVENILEDYKKEKVIDHTDIFDQPDTDIITDMMDKLLMIIFPGFFQDKSYKFYNMNSRLTVLIEDVMFNLNKQIAIALKQSPDNEDMDDKKREEEAERISIEFFKKIPKIREYVETDVEAFFDGDPAAYNKNEII